MSTELILIVDDDPKIRRLVRIELTAQGYQVATVDRGLDAVSFVSEQRPKLVILDIRMPGIDGLETLRRIRAVANVPVILLSAKGGESDKIDGLEVGADDYVTKPFSPEELAARVRAVLRRAAVDEQGATVSRYVAGDLTIDLARRTVTIAGKVMGLSRMEWQLLRYLCANAGRVILHEDLLSSIWGPDFRDDLQYLRVWVSRLRQKLGDNPANPRIIRTVSGVGYVLNAVPEGEEASVAIGEEAT